MRSIQIVALACLLLSASAQLTPAQNYNPVSLTVNSAPYDLIATPITPSVPYSQAAYQCNVTGDSRYPPYASGTFPLTISVPVGQRVRVIFANGNLNGATVTQQGEPGVIVQQGGSPIVQQAGGASPIVQKVSSPVVQQNAPPAAMVVQQTPTVVQQPSYPQAAAIPNPPAVVQQPPSTPSTTPAATTAPKTSSPPPATTPPASPVTQTPPASPVTQTPPASPVTQTPPASPVTQTPPASPVTQTPPTTPVVQPPPSTISQPPSTGRKLLQDTVPGGPNNGLVEYVALASANTVPGFFAGSTQFGVPYVEFTASAAAAGQVASFRGALEVAQVVGGVPQYPFKPNPSLSPECQVNVNFKVA